MSSLPHIPAVDIDGVRLVLDLADAPVEILRDLLAERQTELVRASVLEEQAVQAATLEVAPSKHLAFTCLHRGVSVHEHSRRVVCKTCGEEIDPVEALLAYARHERKFQFSSEAARNERDRLNREVEALRRERANLKAAIRRGATSQGEPCQSPPSPTTSQSSTSPPRPSRPRRPANPSSGA